MIHPYITAQWSHFEFKFRLLLLVRRVSAAAWAGKAAIDVGGKQYRPNQLK